MNWKKIFIGIGILAAIGGIMETCKSPQEKALEKQQVAEYYRQDSIKQANKKIEQEN